MTSPLAKASSSDVRFALDGGITALCISADARVAVVGGAAGGVRVLNIANLDSGRVDVVAALEGHAEGESVEALEFVDLLGGGPTGAAGREGARGPGNVISAGTDGKAVVWDLAAGKVRCEVVHEVSASLQTAYNAVVRVPKSLTDNWSALICIPFLIFNRLLSQHSLFTLVPRFSAPPRRTTRSVPGTRVPGPASPPTAVSPTECCPSPWARMTASLRAQRRAGLALMPIRHRDAGGNLSVRAMKVWRLSLGFREDNLVGRACAQPRIATFLLFAP